MGEAAGSIPASDLYLFVYKPYKQIIAYLNGEDRMTGGDIYVDHGCAAWIYLIRKCAVLLPFCSLHVFPGGVFFCPFSSVVERYTCNVKVSGSNPEWGFIVFAFLSNYNI